MYVHDPHLSGIRAFDQSPVISSGVAKIGGFGGDPQLNPLDFTCFFRGVYGGIRRKSPVSCPIEGALTVHREHQAS